VRLATPFLRTLSVAFVGVALAATSADASVVYDQYQPGWAAPNYSIKSQDENVNGAYNNLEVQAADDFTVPSGEYWRLREVDVRGVYSGRDYKPDRYYHTTPAGPAQSVDVYFYRDNGGTPSGSAPIASFTALAFNDPSTKVWAYSSYSDAPDKVSVRGADFQIPLGEPVSLPPGTYWVSVWARQNAVTRGYWSWRSTTVHGTGAMVYSQGHCPYAGWSFANTCGSGGPDLVYRLSGEFLDGLSYQSVGDGRGTVTSTGQGTGDFDCGPEDCLTPHNRRFARGNRVTFKASASTSSPNSVFGGWHGCDQPSGTTCTMLMNSPGHTKKLEAQFDVASGLSIRKIGKSDGRVTSSPDRVHCPVGACVTQANYYKFSLGSQVLLGADGSSNPSSLFVGWQGCDHPYGSVCVMYMDDPAHSKKVFARFEPASGLSIQKLGAGDGTISSIPDKVQCGVGACKDGLHYFKFLTGSKVTLKAVPRANPKSTFGGWQGCDHPSGLSCVMDMNNTQHSKKLYATFK
jgi:hypothetical protein